MQAETLWNFWLDVRISDSDLEGDKKIWLFMEIKLFPFDYLWK